MERVVVDTNVLVSAALSPTSTPGRVVEAAFSLQFELVVSRRLLDETSAVLRRPKFASLIMPSQVESFIEAVEEIGAWVADPDVVEALLRDPDDDYLVALALSCGAEALVSGDGDLLEATSLPVPVLTPRDFINVISAQ